MTLAARALPLLALLAAVPARAQTPVEPFEPASRYRTNHLATQLTGGEEEGRDVVLSLGWMRTGGEVGEWMPRLEVAAGLTTGVARGGSLVERVLAGPHLTLGRAFPAQHVDMGREARAEPYVLGGVGAYGVAGFAGEGTDLGVAPAVSAGVGFRVFTDEWDVELSTFEIVLEKRFGIASASPQIFIRFGRAVPPRARREEPAEDPLALFRALPPPPGA
ncbi:MAG TPA: hypothetical protein VHG91_07490 [Longimicrobium sp.]|nr:hypothetical protein [Longimicrobium sp.]